MALDERRTREELISELKMLRDRVVHLESLLSDRDRPEVLHDFQRLFDAFDTPVSLLDTDFRFQAVNAAYEEYLGVARETLIGRTPVAIVGEEVFRNDILGKLQRCLEGEVVSFSLWVDYKGKGRRLMDVTYAPRLDRTGRVEGILLVSRDVTQRYHIEQEATAIAETAFSGYLVVDVRGSVIDTNDLATVMLGYSRDEILRLRLWEIDALVSEEEALEEIRRLSRLGRKRFETRLRTREGALLDVEVSATYLEHGGGKVCAFLRDITRFRRIERELRESEARFKALHDASFGGIAILDQGVIQDCNQGLSDLSGYTSQELAGMDAFRLIAEESRPVVMANFLAGYEFPYEVTGLRKNGEKYPLRLQARNIPFGDRQVRSVEFRDITETAKARQALEDGHARLKAVVENMPVMLDAFDEDDRIVFWNKQCERVTGFTLEDVTTGPDPLARLYPDPVYRQRIFDRVEKADGQFVDFEFDLACRDGSVRTIAWSNVSRQAPIPGWKTWAVGVDVTERRRVEQALRESERQYRSVVDNMQDVYFRTDNDGLLTMVSPSSAAMFRFASHEEAIGRPAASFYKFSEDREKALEELRRNGFVRDFETTFVRDDGTTFHVSANSAFFHDENGNILGVEGVLKDITQRKEAQQRIERSEAKFRSLFHHAGEGIFIVDRDMSITDANHAAARILGYDDSAELVGLKPGDIIHPEDVHERSVKANIAEAVRGKVLRFERRYRRKDGSYVPVQITVKSLKESGMHHVLFSDISERKRMEEALKTKIVALTQPAGDCSAITFESVFDMEEIQRIQDEFARATGVASLITRPDGVPLTRPSNFQRFCSDIVRKTTLGACNCSRSDAVVGQGAEDGPRVQQCLSAGLWDAGASISVGGRHVASWLIGQVRDATQSEDAIRAYAMEIGTDEDEAVRAFRDLPVMSRDQFQAIAQALHTLARHISVLAFQNLQQARFIEAKNRAEGNHRLLAKILNTSDSVAVYKDTSLRYMMVNNEFLRLTGYASHSDVVGRMDQEVLEGLVVQEHIDRYAKTDRLALALPRGESLTVEESYSRQDGSARIFQTKKFPIFDGGAPEPIGVASLSSEITEVKRIQDRLAQEKARAEAANTAKTEFLANMSHEIRTPLNGICGMMQLLHITKLDQEQSEYIEMAMRSTTRLTKLLTDILDISRIEAGKLEVVRREFCVRDLVQSVSELFDVTHREKNVTLLCRIDPSTPEVLVGDEARIRQILFNLVGNGFKFSDRGGVTLEIYPVHSSKTGEQRIAFSVHDTGIGIPEDKLRELFTPFAQVETSYSRSHQGAGLGLAIVKRLATLMDGHVIMDTLPGEGTSAYVILPFMLPRAATELLDLEPASQMEPLPAMNVLLVEDERSNRFFMLKLLEKAGVRISAAKNGREAIELWEVNDFDCILMDIQMPVMDGVEATRQIRNSQTGAKADIPIIALTSYAMAGDRERFLAAGMDAYLGKPVRWDELKEALESAYRKNRGRPR